MKPSSFLGDRSSGRATHDLTYQLSKRGFRHVTNEHRLGDKREPDLDLRRRGSLEGIDAAALVGQAPVRSRRSLTRWRQAGAEAILKLRALRANGDLDDYWDIHLTQEHHRIHRSHYADDLIALAA